MDFSTCRSRTLATLSVLALLGASVLASDDARPAGETGFSGRWALSETKDDVVRQSKSGGWSNIPGGDEGYGSAGGRSAGGGFDLPIEVMTDARRLVVVDDGATFRVHYPTGRKRTFVTDGVKRYLDDGDGPADVTALRKGITITISSEWFRGYKLKESWELRANPRRLVVTGKLKGRESQQYVRTFMPAPPEEPALPGGTAGVPASPATAVPEGGGSQASFGAAPLAVDHLAECSIHPPRKASSDDLNRLVRISQEEAGRAAVASLAPLKPGDVISSEVEPYEGCLVWPFTLRLPSRNGVQEVFVDAGDGKIVWSEFVPMGPSTGEKPAP
jgi:hypothetical protein